MKSRSRSKLRSAASDTGAWVSRHRLPPCQKLSSESLCQIAETWATPSFVYDLDKVRFQARELGTHIQHPRRQLLYAIKANPRPAVVRALLAEGYGIDAVSPGEVELALALGCPADKICYTENNMTDAEQAEAVAHGVMINCGSLDRLRRLAEAGVQQAAVRFNPDIGDSEHAHTLTAGPLTKFGIHHSQIAEVRAIEAEFGMQVVGCHAHWLECAERRQLRRCHGGDRRSGKGPAAFTVGRCWRWFGRALSTGSSPHRYRSGGRSADQLIADLEAFHARPLELRLEPGRYLVAEAGYLLTTVTSVKTNPDGRTYVGCDSGFNHLIRPMMYGSYHPIANVSNPQGAAQVVDIVGMKPCESGDVFARERSIPQPRLGDVLAIGCAGAYGMSMGSTYNIRPLPAEIITEDGTPRLVRRRRNDRRFIR